MLHKFVFYIFGDVGDGLAMTKVSKIRPVRRTRIFHDELGLGATRLCASPLRPLGERIEGVCVRIRARGLGGMIL